MKNTENNKKQKTQTEPTKHSSRWKNLLLNGMLVIGSSLFAILLFLIIGEIWIRSQELPASTGSIHISRDDQRPQAVLRPGAQEIWGGVPVRINSLGFRGREYRVEKPENTVRIIALGDSFTFGYGAPEEVIFPTILEQKLNEIPNHYQYEVLNLGVEDYNTEDELAFLKKVGLQLNPDIVLLFYVLNDIELKPEYLDHQKNDQKDRPQTHETQQAQRQFRDSLYNTVVTLRKYSHFLAYLAPRIAALGRNLGLDLPSSGSDWSRMYEENVEGWQRSKQAMLEIKKLAHEHNFQFALILFPLFTNLTNNYPALRSHEIIAQFTQENEILFLDLFPYYKGIEATSLWVSPTDGHPNAKGHAIAAQAVFEFLTDHPDWLKMKKN